MNGSEHLSASGQLEGLEEPVVDAADPVVAVVELEVPPVVEVEEPVVAGGGGEGEEPPPQASTAHGEVIDGAKSHGT